MNEGGEEEKMEEGNIGEEEMIGTEEEEYERRLGRCEKENGEEEWEEGRERDMGKE